MAAKKRATKKTARKKAVKKKGKHTSTAANPITITHGHPKPKSHSAKKGELVHWDNLDAKAHTIHFDHSPFLASEGSQAIDVANGSAEKRVIDNPTRKYYGYSILDSYGAIIAGGPAHPPEVVVG